jgi:diamine N-acetyltransferase
MMSRITLQEITAKNWREVARLRVSPAQEKLVVSNLESLVEAAYGLPGDLSHLKLFPFAVYAETTLVGFTLYNTQPARDRFFISRLMIDAQHQGRGYGTATIKLLLQLFRANPQAKEVATSFVVGNEAARKTYLACGFRKIGMESENEILMWQALNPQPEAWTSIWREDLPEKVEK